MVTTFADPSEIMVFQYLGFAVTTGVTGGGSSGVTTGATLGVGTATVFSDVDGETMNFRSIEGTGGTEVFTVGDTVYIWGSTSGTSSGLKNVGTGTTTYNATNDDDYIGMSGGTPVLLPSGSLLGKEITVADIKGDALTNPIIVLGNGNNINGNSSATINTDYGSITMLWNGYFWSVTAFVN